MKTFKQTCAASILAVGMLCSAAQVWAGEDAVQRPEKLAIDKKGIKVWTFRTANNPAFSYRATTTVDASISSVAALILDTGYLSKWVPYVSEVNVLDRDDQAGTFSIRMQMDFPFPLQDRDVVVKGKISQAADGVVTIRNQIGTDPRVPVRAKIVRISRYEGEWVLKPLAANKVEVTTVGYADPGGSVPLSVANMFVEQQPYEMMLKMKDQVKRYHNVTTPLVVDPFTKK